MAPVQTAEGYASAGAHATYGAASTGAHVVYTTGGDVYTGVGRAAKQPLRDLNMMQDPIPAVLLRTESKPYDLAGVNSCEAVLNQVAELDLALGPDLDSPKDRGRSRSTRGADAAASAALLAAADAADHFIPMRGMIKEVSGATRYENHVKHAVLAGTVRRAFLKAIGMAHNCGWPASPLVFNPVQVAVASGTWTAPTESGLQMVAIATPAPLAVPPVAGSFQATMIATTATPRAPQPIAPASSASMRSSPAPQILAARTVLTQPLAVPPVPGSYSVNTVIAAARSPIPADRSVTTRSGVSGSLTLASTSPAPRASATASHEAFEPRAISVSTADPAESRAAAQPAAYSPVSDAAFVSPSSPAAPWSSQNPPHP